jgi:hypothetical protein
MNGHRYTKWQRAKGHSNVFRVCLHCGVSMWRPQTFKERQSGKFKIATVN